MNPNYSIFRHVTLIPLLLFSTPTIADYDWSWSNWRFADAVSNRLMQPASGELNYNTPLLDQSEFEPIGSASPKKANTGLRYSEAQINEMINNPLGELWLLFMRNDTSWIEGEALDLFGEDTKVFNTTRFQPVMSFQLTRDWKYIFRPIVPVHYWNAPTTSFSQAVANSGGTPPFSIDFDDRLELGDLELWNLFATNEMAKPPNIYGFGFTATLDTATDDFFGDGKWSAGPMAMAIHIGPPGGFIYGAIVQHRWDIAGDSERSDVSRTSIQYIGFYRLTAKTSIGIGSPTIYANWEADKDNRWTIPIGIAMNTTVKIGPIPAKIGIELYKYVERPDNLGPEYGISLQFVPVVPKPAFSKRPIFDW